MRCNCAPSGTFPSTVVPCGASLVSFAQLGSQAPWRSGQARSRQSRHDSEEWASGGRVVCECCAPPPSVQEREGESSQSGAGSSTKEKKSQTGDAGQGGAKFDGPTPNGPGWCHEEAMLCSHLPADFFPHTTSDRPLPRAYLAQGMVQIAAFCPQQEGPTRVPCP